MKVVNELYPSDPAQMQAMMEKGPDGPIFMVNLLKFKERAEYEDGRESNLSGREAYMIYGRAVGELLPKFGGRPVFVGDVTFLSLGQAEELWDEVAKSRQMDSLCVYPLAARTEQMRTLRRLCAATSPLS